MTNANWPGDLPGKGQGEIENQAWVWTTTLIPELLAMLRVLPRPIRLEFPKNPTWTDRTQTVQAIHRAQVHIRTMIDVPEHIRGAALVATGETITAYAMIRHLHDHPDRWWATEPTWRALGNAQDHTRAVNAFYGVRPDMIAELEF